jgi:hypothetical protein
LSFLALAVVASAGSGQEPQKNKEKASDPPALKLDATAVRKLVEQLGGSDFKTREKAAQELSKLEEVPDALREAITSGDLETKRRAEAVVTVITARAEEKAFQAMVADLHKIEVDRFVRRMITDEKFARDNEWKVIEKLAKTVTKRANDQGGRKYPVPDFDMKSLPLANLAVERVGFNGKRILLDNYTNHITSVSGCVVLCTGPMPRMTGLSNSIVIVDGDFTRATTLMNCLLIVRGKIGGFTGVRNSIILATDEFGTKLGFGNDEELQGATSCHLSFLQVKNAKIRFTTSNESVLIKTVPRTTGPTTSQVLDTDKGPLQLLKFSAGKIVPDDKLVWGKESGGLAVAIAPAERPDSFMIRWKNVGKETLELQSVRFNSDILARSDDLLNHVLVKGPDGKLLAARQPKLPPVGGARRRPGTVILEPGKSYEETIDLVTYVDRPVAKGRYKLSIEPDIPNALAPPQKGATYWTGKIQSNELDITFGK